MINENVGNNFFAQRHKNTPVQLWGVKQSDYITVKYKKCEKCTTGAGFGGL